MRNALIKATSVGTLLLPFTAGATALLEVDASGQLIGATSVEVDGTFYDVEFVEGSCVDVFNGCDDTGEFTFPDQVDASLAAAALLAQVFLDDPLGMFDSDPSLTRGCATSGNVGPDGCAIRTAWGILDGGQFLSFDAFNFVDPAMDATDTNGGSPFLSSVWAVWSEEPSSAISEPATITLILTGLWAASHRRRRQE